MAKITAINIGDINTALAEWYNLPPDHPANQPEIAPILCFLISTPNRQVLVDAAAYTFPPGYESMVIPSENRPSLKAQLEGLGIYADQITDLVITHPHVDHVNGLAEDVNGQYHPIFSKARHYLGAADWQPEQFAPFQRQNLGTVAEAGLLELVNGALDLGDGLSILPMPGETPGHQVVRLKEGELEVYFAGDLYHHPLEFAEDINVVWAEPKSMGASKRAFSEHAAKTGAKVYFSHIEGACEAVWEGTALRWVRDG